MEFCACTDACVHLPSSPSIRSDDDSEQPEANRVRNIECVYAGVRLVYSPYVERHAFEAIHWLIWSHRLGHQERIGHAQAQ